MAKSIKYHAQTNLKLHNDRIKLVVFSCMVAENARKAMPSKLTNKIHIAKHLVRTIIISSNSSDLR